MNKALCLASLLVVSLLVLAPTTQAIHSGGLRTVRLTISRVDIVYTTDLAIKGTVITVAEQDQTINLLALQGGVLAPLGIDLVSVFAALGIGLPVFVTQIRLVVSAAVLEIDGFVAPLRIPGNVVKLDISPCMVFAVPINTDVVFDFDAEKQIIDNPGRGFMLKPVIEVFRIGPGADLIVESLTHSPETPTTTDTITFTAMVKNVGGGWAGYSILNFRVGGETFGVNFTIPMLGPGESFTVERQEVLDVAQNYRNTVTADIGNNVCEGNEDNNVKTDDYTVVSP